MAPRSLCLCLPCSTVLSENDFTLSDSFSFDISSTSTAVKFTVFGQQDNYGTMKYEHLVMIFSPCLCLVTAAVRGSGKIDLSGYG